MMTFVRIKFLAALCAVPLYAVPIFDVNLDSPPEERWVGVAGYYKAEIANLLEHVGIPMVDQHGVDPLTARQWFEEPQYSWLKDMAFDEEYEKELLGIANVVNDPKVTVPRLKWLNMIYEMNGPNYSPGWYYGPGNYKPGCTSVLWASQSGIVMHGRNSDDDSVKKEMGGLMHIPNGDFWGPLTLEVTMHRSGRPLLKMTTLAGMVGISTGMRYGHNGNAKGWSFAQHSRDIIAEDRWIEKEQTRWQLNMKAGAMSGQVSALAVRRIMETTDDYDTAVNLLYATPFMAPQYFIVSGSGQNQGSVLTINRMALQDQSGKVTPPIQLLSFNDTRQTGFLVQTNDEPWQFTPHRDWDPRRQLAFDVLESQAAQLYSNPHYATNEDGLLQLMHTNPIHNEGTVYSVVMVPTTGYYKTTLPKEAPQVVDGYKLNQQLTDYGDKDRLAIDKNLLSNDGSYAQMLESYEPVPVKPEEAASNEHTSRDIWCQSHGC